MIESIFKSLRSFIILPFPVFYYTLLTRMNLGAENFIKFSSRLYGYKNAFFNSTNGSFETAMLYDQLVCAF